MQLATGLGLASAAGASTVLEEIGIFPSVWQVAVPGPQGTALGMGMEGVEPVALPTQHVWQCGPGAHLSICLSA